MPDNIRLIINRLIGLSQIILQVSAGEHFERTKIDSEVFSSRARQRCGVLKLCSSLERYGVMHTEEANGIYVRIDNYVHASYWRKAPLSDGYRDECL